MSEKRTILIVEDSIDTRKLLRFNLELSGYRVVEAIDGQEALEIIQHETPDLILMDLSLPKHDGFYLTITIKRIERLRNVPIIICSAHSTHEMKARALDFGGADFVAKPIDLDVLNSVIKRHLK